MPDYKDLDKNLLKLIQNVSHFKSFFSAKDKTEYDL